MGVRNVAPYVRAAIRSALAQTRGDLDVVVVDDGSTDDTVAVARQIADARLRVVPIEHRGAPAALNHGIAVSRSRYVAFLDGDDLWAPGKAARHIAFMDEAPHVDLTFSRSRLIDEDGEDLHVTTRAPRRTVQYDNLLTDNVIGNGSSVVVRRSALEQAGPFDESLRGGYDLDVWLRIARQRSANIVCLPEILTFYRRRRGQITRDWTLMGDCLERVFERHRLADPSRVTPLARIARSNRYRYMAAVAYETGACTIGVRLLGRSLRANPWHFARTPRSYLVGLALLAGVTLPGSLRRQAERAMALTVERVQVPASNFEL